MDEHAKELIAIGASVAGHCQPCLAYHVTKARELGVDDEDIQAAIDVGHLVEKGAMSAMREFAKSAVGTSVQQTPACVAERRRKTAANAADNHITRRTLP